MGDVGNCELGLEGDCEVHLVFMDIAYTNTLLCLSTHFLILWLNINLGCLPIGLKVQRSPPVSVLGSIPP